MIMFSSLDIEVVNKARKQAEAARRGIDPAAGQVGGRSNDPVRMYLRKMGSVSLLTREGEVEIAKRIEQGVERMDNLVLKSPVAVPFILVMYDDIKRGKVRPKDVIAIATPNDGASGGSNQQSSAPANQEEALDNLQKQVERMRRHHKELERIKAAFKGEQQSPRPAARSSPRSSTSNPRPSLRSSRI